MGLSQIKQSTSATAAGRGVFVSLFLFSVVGDADADALQSICLIALVLFDQRAYSPADISLLHVAHLPLYFTKSFIQSFIFFSPSRSPLLSTRQLTHLESFPPQT